MHNRLLRGFSAAFSTHQLVISRILKAYEAASVVVGLSLVPRSLVLVVLGHCFEGFISKFSFSFHFEVHFILRLILRFIKFMNFIPNESQRRIGTKHFGMQCRSI